MATSRRSSLHSLGGLGGGVSAAAMRRSSLTQGSNAAALMDHMLAFPRLSFGGMPMGLSQQLEHAYSSSGFAPSMLYEPVLYDQRALLEEPMHRGIQLQGAHHQNAPHHGQAQQHASMVMHAAHGHGPYNAMPNGLSSLGEGKEDELVLSLEGEDEQPLYSAQAAAASLLDPSRAARPRSSSYSNYAGAGALGALDMYPELEAGDKQRRLMSGSASLKKFGIGALHNPFGSLTAPPPQQQQQQQQQPTVKTTAATTPAGSGKPSQAVGAKSPPKKGKPGATKTKAKSTAAAQQKKPKAATAASAAAAAAAASTATAKTATAQTAAQKPSDAATSRGKKRPLTSKYRGVCWYKRTKRWVVQIKVNGQRRHVGYYKDELDAAIAYDKALQEMSQIPSNRLDCGAAPAKPKPGDTKPTLSAAVP